MRFRWRCCWNPPANAEDVKVWVRYPGWEDLLEMLSHSSIRTVHNSEESGKAADPWSQKSNLTDISAVKSLLTEIQDQIKTMTHFFFEAIGRDGLFVVYVKISLSTVVFTATTEPKIERNLNINYVVIQNEGRKMGYFYVNFNNSEVPED